ncbi:hypothetical protein RI685_03860 [Clavibacter michiganensis]|uniref:hypothetical protein n=1 Tax=Clavibacter michiganensis TaxID=28447 RepID=UPI000B571DE9|nr:hypothetical protein [Clavibacter michiganensis]NIY59574.1 hypothetical protein [Clavibacter michiganensis subsp. michiganensis]OUD91417.1 hypothetical protein CMMCAS05_09620 [Clavibacter michiganensis subsp. michiganensis]OUE02922.1 hypothetical protein CMMCAS04_01300 [Clavibacter michiganensis subsp. michiganensis]OUE11220.1 hypothetical protein CMMCA001_14075 [Clavibacter michiganensis subsp. michiganensis]OUE12111.1 hypothetical protein CMMCAY01_03800 [Clavibacter michiganensis subsp. m
MGSEPVLEVVTPPLSVLEPVDDREPVREGSAREPSRGRAESPVLPGADAPRREGAAA